MGFKGFVRGFVRGLYVVLRTIKHAIDYLWTYFLFVVNAVVPGNHLALGRGARIAWGSLVFGNVMLGSSAYIGPGSTVRGYVRIGKGTKINGNAWIAGGRNKEEGIFIGNYCAIARDFAAITVNHNYACVPLQGGLAIQLGVDRRKISASKGPIYVGSDVWIGYHVTLLPGSSVGDGSVVGAMSVVTRRIPPFSIAVGNPARVVGSRFPEDIADEIARSKWWLLDVSDLMKISDVFGIIDSRDAARRLRAAVDSVFHDKSGN